MAESDDQAREMTRAVDRLGEIVGDLALAINQFLEYQRQYQLEMEERGGPSRWIPSPCSEDLARAGMVEGEAVELAKDAAREARNMLGYGSEYDVASGRLVEKLPPPGPEDVKRWEHLREERRKAEDR